MLTKLNNITAVDKELIASITSETVGIEHRRTITIITLKDGSRLRVSMHPLDVLSKLKVE